MAKNKLTDTIRREIVVRLACWEGEAAVRSWLKSEHKLELASGALSYYNMDNRSSRAAAGKSAKGQVWIKLFDETRAAAAQEVMSIRTAHLAERMRLRERLIDALLTDPRTGRPKTSISSVDAQDVDRLLESQARDKGGMYTNQRIHKVDAAGALAQLLGCDPSELPGGNASAQP